MRSRYALAQVGLSVVALAATSFGALPPAAAATFLGLGDVPNHSWSFATGVSNDGAVVVGYGTALPGTGAFRWTTDGMVFLGDFPGGAVWSGATGVSADGSVVVGWGEPGSNEQMASYWTAVGGMVELGTLAGGSGQSSSNAVSSDGLVVVGGSSSASGYEAFRWTAGGGMVGLGDLPGGSFSSGAIGVSSNGSVIVGRSSSTFGDEAFRWTASNGMVGLGDLPGGSFGSTANGVSSDGSVVVGSSSSQVGLESVLEAFRWTTTGGMEGLGFLPGDTYISIANDVSADGSRVVGSGQNASDWEAFIWDEANGMASLRDFLVDDYGIDLTGWTLRHASSISDNGLVIVGEGLHNGVGEAWIVVIPEPCTAVLLMTGLLGLSYRRTQLRRAAHGAAAECPRPD